MKLVRRQQQERHHYVYHITNIYLVGEASQEMNTLILLSL